MIRYTLACRAGHRFEAWFGGSAAFDAQQRAGLVTCPDCGVAQVDKAPMAPAVATKGQDGPAPAPPRPAPSAAPPKPSAAPAAMPVEVARAVRALHARVRAESDYVGDRFAAEARRRHLDDPDARPVWGEATAEQARDLLEDGVPVAPLPPLPRQDD